MMRPFMFVMGPVCSGGNGSRPVFRSAGALQGFCHLQKRPEMTLIVILF